MSINYHLQNNTEQKLELRYGDLQSLEACALREVQRQKMPVTEKALQFIQKIEDGEEEGEQLSISESEAQEITQAKNLKSVYLVGHAAAGKTYHTTAFLDSKLLQLESKGISTYKKVHTLETMLKTDDEKYSDLNILIVKEDLTNGIGKTIFDNMISQISKCEENIEKIGLSHPGSQLGLEKVRVSNGLLNSYFEHVSTNGVRLAYREAMKNPDKKFVLILDFPGAGTNYSYSYSYTTFAYKDHLKFGPDLARLTGFDQCLISYYKALIPKENRHTLFIHTEFELAKQRMHARGRGLEYHFLCENKFEHDGDFVSKFELLHRAHGSEGHIRKLYEQDNIMDTPASNSLFFANEGTAASVEVISSFFDLFLQ